MSERLRKQVDEAREISLPAGGQAEAGGAGVEGNHEELKKKVVAGIAKEYQDVITKTKDKGKDAMDVMDKITLLKDRVNKQKQINKELISK